MSVWASVCLGAGAMFIGLSTQRTFWRGMGTGFGLVLIAGWIAALVEQLLELLA